MNQATQMRSGPRVVEHRPEPPAQPHRAAEAPQQIERRIVVPLVDEPEAGRIVYRPEMLWWALGGAVLGAGILGAVAWFVASGTWAIAGVGQFAAGGASVASFTGAGTGAAVGALTGALAVLYRTPAHRMNSCDADCDVTPSKDAVR